ncbi:MAG: response regulator [Myxococcota bacterium]
MTDRIRVLVVDDSPFICRLLSMHLQAEDDLEVVGTALSGERAIQLVKELRPNAITLDLDMPDMSGIEVLQQVMTECPTPVIMITGASRRAAESMSKALELGAIDFVLKSVPGLGTSPQILGKEIVGKVRAASKIKVIRSLKPRFDKQVQQRAEIRRQDRMLDRPERVVDQAAREGVVVIGASTGGPLAVRELLSELQADFPIALVIVQHMPGTFTGLFADQLDRYTPISSKRRATAIKLGLEQRW